jgi:hypothetical protein
VVVPSVLSLFGVFRESAIAYTMGLELTRLVAPRVVLELPGNEIDVARDNQTVATGVKRGELLDHRGHRGIASSTAKSSS